MNNRDGELRVMDGLAGVQWATRLGPAQVWVPIGELTNGSPVPGLVTLVRASLWL